jgi:hypothetical protein
MNVSITDQLAGYVRTKVKSGRYIQGEFAKSVVDHLIAEVPIFQHLGFRVWFRDGRQ